METIPETEPTVSKNVILPPIVITSFPTISEPEIILDIESVPCQSIEDSPFAAALNTRHYLMSFMDMDASLKGTGELASLGIKGLRSYLVEKHFARPEVAENAYLEPIEIKYLFDLMLNAQIDLLRIKQGEPGANYQVFDIMDEFEEYAMSNKNRGSAIMVMVLDGKCSVLVRLGIGDYVYINPVEGKFTSENSITAVTLLDGFDKSKSNMVFMFQKA